VTVVTPLVFHDNCDDWPSAIERGSALKKTIWGKRIALKDDGPRRVRPRATVAARSRNRRKRMRFMAAGGADLPPEEKHLNSKWNQWRTG
jgi:hypothetical protein